MSRIPTDPDAGYLRKRLAEVLDRLATLETKFETMRCSQTEPTGHVLPELLTIDAVAALLSLSTRSIWRLVKQGRLPEPVRLSQRMVRWFRADVMAYLSLATAYLPV